MTNRSIYVDVKRRSPILGVIPRQSFYFRVVGANGEPIAQSEQYVEKRDAIAAAELVVGPGIEVRDLT